MKGSDIYALIQREIPIEDSWITEKYGPNELFNQSKDYTKILYCVTPTVEVEKYCIEKGYDLLISHHPFTSDLCPQIILHTALDCCRGGLNDMWAEMLGVKEGKSFDKKLGIYGKIEPATMAELKYRIESFIGHPIKGEVYSRKCLIESVVICTGLGGLVYDLALATKADCFIIGESVRKRDEFEALIEVGHTLTERCGVLKLKEVLGLDIDLAPLELDVFNDEVFTGR